MGQSRFLIGALSIILAGCAGAPANVTTPTPVSAPTAVHFGNAGSAMVEERARTALAAHVVLASTAVVLGSSESIQWPTAALGCPADGTAAAQVLTPGYRLQFTVDREPYTVHTNADGTIVVLCQQQQPTRLR